MSTLNITSVGTNAFQWYLSGLTYLWDTAQYEHAGIGPAPVTDGEVVGPSTQWSTVYPPPAPNPDPAQNYTPWTTASGFTPGATYTVYAFIRNPSGQWFNAGSATVTMLAPSRPSNFAWTTAKAAGAAIPTYSGKPAPCTAAEWSAFTTRINDFRAYKSLAAYSFSTAVTGNNFPIVSITEARSAISAMSPPTPVPGSPSKVTAAIFNDLRDSLNSIP